ncbi:hypothetical protein [Pseudoalteromonas piscicida]|uniref:hypothetical protein n=1 Tax=Pseudoalteromonas piscicida TaxID=43662 RepID=UPI000E35A44D|nr:hypothetical protein [Pseudoalteromonas piscicida]AXQ99043.1 hypothetical protein D0N37_15830 [Pseudoalteromonas piscicida]
MYTFFILNNIFIGILNGKKEIKLLTVVNIFSSFFVLLFSVFFINSYSLSGALIAISVNQGLVIFVTLFFLRGKGWFKFSSFTLPVNIVYIKDVLSFASITLFSVLFANTSTFLVRYLLIGNLGVTEAGIWQGMWSICQAFLLILSMSMSVYIVPIISKLNNRAIEKEVKKILAFVFPVFLSVCLMGFIFRDYIILVLFSDEFLAARNLFLWHMIGLSLKSIAWVYGYILVVKKQVFNVFISELSAAVLLVISTFYFINFFGVVGTSYAFFITSLLHCLLTFFFYKNYLR